jgi:hypothetical protein
VWLNGPVFSPWYSSLFGLCAGIFSLRVTSFSGGFRHLVVVALKSRFLKKSMNMFLFSLAVGLTPFRFSWRFVYPPLSIIFVATFHLSSFSYFHLSSSNFFDYFPFYLILLIKIVSPGKQKKGNPRGRT